MRNNLLALILLVIAAIPCLVLASDDCRLIEYPDHYEAVCEGDATYAPPKQTEDRKPVTVVVVNGERRPPRAAMENAAAARRKLILELRQKDLDTNSPEAGMSR